MKKMAEKRFGNYQGTEVKIFTLKSEKLEVDVIELGATLHRVRAKGKDGQWYDVVLFHNTLEDYLNSSAYWSAVCGRHANRIAKGEIRIAGKIYHSDINEGNNSLHSGKDGFHFKVFNGKQETEDAVSLTRLSPDGEQGFPGNMLVKITYTITPENGVKITYQTTTDKDTVWNITNHAYFNLAGKGTVLDHILYVNSDFYTPVDDELLTTGEIIQVEETPYDLRTPILLNTRIGNDTGKLADGFDNNFVLRRPGEGVQADLYCPQTGIGVQLYTSLPAVQIYSAAAMNGELSSGGNPVPQFGGLCMETQYFPNSFAHTHFPQPIQKAGTLVKEETEYRFYNK